MTLLARTDPDSDDYRGLSMFIAEKTPGTADDPFLNRAVITIRGQRTAYELPVYGAKTIAVRTGELHMHGR